MHELECAPPFDSDQIDMRRTNELTRGTKTYYHPIEAAIRWAGLLRFESKILKALDAREHLRLNESARWPLLRLYADRIFDGMTHGELAYGKSGLVRERAGADFEGLDVTIRHVDLKVWVAHYYPGEKPSFLFDEFERGLHPAINPHALSVLLAEREATQVELTKLNRAHESLRAAHDALTKDHHARLAEVDAARELGPRSESTYLNIIGGLLALLLGKSPSGIAYSTFRNTDAVISALLAHYEGRPGLSERTLWAKLSRARRHLMTSR